MGAGGVILAVNGEKVAVPERVNLNTSLADFIRTETRYKGTKIACGEGGCGACAVEVSTVDPITGKVQTRSINSCLAPIGGLDGAAVTTVEGIGNSETGFHPIQERFAGFHASQCGFCTPGFVVAAHGVLRKAEAARRPATAEDFQSGLDGNLCRCTGYRPIIDACKSLTGCADLEDLGICAPGCQHSAAAPADTAFPSFLRDCPAAAISRDGGTTWRRPKSLAELAAAVEGVKPGDLGLLAGNTGAGIYKETWPKEAIVVDVRGMSELNYVCRSKGALEVGAAVTLSALIEELQRGNASEGAAWRHMASHLLRIAGTHVRNAATIGGNLTLARSRGLESDLATVLMGAGATVNFSELAASADGRDTRAASVEDFLSLEGDLRLLVTGVSVPSFEADAVFRSHKVAQRFFNSHAIVNGAVSFRRRRDGALADVRVVIGNFDTPDVGECQRWLHGPDVRAAL